MSEPEKPKNPYGRYEDEAKGFRLGPPPEPPKEEEAKEAPKPGEDPKPTPGKP